MVGRVLRRKHNGKLRGTDNHPSYEMVRYAHCKCRAARGRSNRSVVIHPGRCLQVGSLDLWADSAVQELGEAQWAAIQVCSSQLALTAEHLFAITVHSTVLRSLY